VTSLISAYYYLRVVVFMYFKEAGTAEEIHIPRLAFISLVISGFGIILLGILPSLILDVTKLLF